MVKLLPSLGIDHFVRTSCSRQENVPSASRLDCQFYHVSAPEQCLKLQVWVNLGSLHLARNEAEEAARMYDAALNRFYGKKDSKVLLWLARAYYDNKDIKKSKMALLKAVHLFPHVQSLLFNLALTMQQAAALVRL